MTTVLPETLAEWQRVVDLTARLARVPASLIMRTERPKHTVLVTSRTEGNPYDVGREYDLHAVLYCQGVVRQRRRAGGRGRDLRPGLGG